MMEEDQDMAVIDAAYKVRRLRQEVANLLTQIESR